MPVTLHQGDCLDILRTLPDNSIHSIVTDPPYGLSFMNRHWDYDVPSTEIWAEALRVLKPGGHLLSFSGTRTYHRMVVAIEDAGFEIRDQIGWLYGSGFPKSLDVSKAIEKAAGAVTVPSTVEAKQWQGWGTALKPAWEPICMARKPLTGTVAANVLEHGTGAINIDDCRVHGGPSTGGKISGMTALGQGSEWNSHNNRVTNIDRTMAAGRWPANVIHDGSEDVMDAFAVYGETKSGKMKRDVEAYAGENVTGFLRGRSGPGNQHGDSGSVARFFYCAKASKADRQGSKHPTVKPVALMRYLVRLVTPKGGVVLDPFAGSGTTGQAAVDEGLDAILIEREAEYCDDIRHRLALFLVDQDSA